MKATTCEEMRALLNVRKPGLVEDMEGGMKDADLAEKYGEAHVSTVTRWRRVLGIKRKKAAAVKNPLAKFTDEQILAECKVRGIQTPIEF